MYKSIFKTYNIRLDNDLVLNQSLALRKDVKYVFTYDISGIGADHYSLHDYFIKNFPRLSLISKALVESEVVLVSCNSAEDYDKKPFDVDDCSKLSVALSILFDCHFAIGGEKISTSNLDHDSGYLAPWASIFKGECRENLLDSSMLDELKVYYSLVEKGFKASSKDDVITKLFFYFLRVVVVAPENQFEVVKMGITNIVDSSEGSVVNAAVLFEYVFTKAGYYLKEGVALWNEEFPLFQVSVDEIRYIHKYRSILVHSNATDAIKTIDKWKKEKSIALEKVIPTLEEYALRNARTIVRCAAKNFEQFKGFTEKLR